MPSLRLTRRDLRILIGLLTGYADLHRHFTLMKEEKETALHLLGRCSALSTTRFTLLDLYHMDYTDLGNITSAFTSEACQSFQKISLASDLSGSAMGPPGGLSAGCCLPAAFTTPKVR